MGSSGRALVAQANVIARGRDGRGGLPLRDGVADLVVCSPPYLWKRKYAISGTGEMGNEANWRLFLDNLWAATDEMLRVLKVGGSIFVNLGDTRVSGREPRWLGIPPKSKLLLPERYRVGCQDRYAAQGVIVRQVNIWEHVNGLPESVTDRTRDSHEDIIHIVKPDRAGRYYSAVDEVRDTAASHYHDRPQYQRAMQIFREAGFTDAHMAAVRAVGVIDSAAGQVRSGGSWESESGRLAWQVREKLGSYYRELCGSNTAPLGKLPGSVWAIEGGSLWDGPINFCPRCGRNLRDAGSGSAGRTERVTVSTGLPTSASVEPPASPTNSGSDPSPTASPSTTSAETRDASTQPTSIPSPSASTSDEATPPPAGTPPRPTATTAMPSTPPTPTSVEVVSESAGCVCEIEPGPIGPGGVWSIPSEPLRLPPWLGVQHYASYPTELPRRIILGWSPSGVCVACGEGRWPVVDRRLVQTQNWSEQARMKQQEGREQGKQRLSGDFTMIGSTEATILGYACACTPFTDHPGTGERIPKRDWTPGPGQNPHSAPPSHQPGAYQSVGPWREYHLDRWTPPPTRPAIVLDPFGGTGTTALVARALGRIGLSFDLSHPYSRAARWRIHHSGDHGKAVSRTNLERQGSLL